VAAFVSGPFFHEFALALPCAAADFVARMRERGIDPGVPLARLTAGSTSAATDANSQATANILLVAVTEVNPPEALDRYIAAAREVLAGLSSTAAGAAA